MHNSIHRTDQNNRKFRKQIITQSIKGNNHRVAVRGRMLQRGKKKGN